VRVGGACVAISFDHGDQRTPRSPGASGRLGRAWRGREESDIDLLVDVVSRGGLRARDQSIVEEALDL
jgi:hypothetical protein